MFDQLLNTVFLGLIQGLAEWLPISSTAHLKIAEHYFGLESLGNNVLFNLILHLGTLIAVVFYFRTEVIDILKALVHLDFKSEYGAMIPLIIVATIPTAIIGLVYDKFLQSTLDQLLIFGITFLMGATLVYTSKLGKEKTDKISYPTAVIMGIAQGLAVFPGLSRSGATISSSLLLGVKREKAFKFSFLLSIPAIIGDTAAEAYLHRHEIATSGLGLSPIDVLVPTLIAMIVGYIAIKLVSKTVASKKFHYFAIYTFLLGTALIILTLTGH
jgi:undecaprenyl-diphosphatase